jgi:hypothetical protein
MKNLCVSIWNAAHCSHVISGYTGIEHGQIYGVIRKWYVRGIHMDKETLYRKNAIAIMSSVPDLERQAFVLMGAYVVFRTQPEYREEYPVLWLLLKCWLMTAYSTSCALSG